MRLHQEHREHQDGLVGAGAGVGEGEGEGLGLVVGVVGLVVQGKLIVPGQIMPGRLIPVSGAGVVVVGVLGLVGAGELGLVEGLEEEGARREDWALRRREGEEEVRVMGAAAAARRSLMYDTEAPG